MISTPIGGDERIERYTLTIDRDHLEGRTFLLGNRGGFVLHLPAATNVRDRTLQSSKWFGASGFGRSFFEGFPLWALIDGHQVGLNRTCQTEFVMRLDSATRVYDVQGHRVSESFFVPDGLQACVITLDADLPLVLQPEFDMRYYQAVDSTFSGYGATERDDMVLVRNTVTDVGTQHLDMHFYGLIGALSGDIQHTMLPEDQRLVRKTYRKDEMRQRSIKSVYAETGAQDPDEAPIWDVYQTEVYAPVRFQGNGPLTLAFAFGDSEEEILATMAQLRDTLPDLWEQKRRVIVSRLEEGALETGNQQLDTIYAHVLTRFDDSLVARDATLHVDPVHRDHYYAIFAGDKYFMDAWKRDENISLGALLVTNDYDTVRKILDDTWQYQDERTGRLPHIIRAGEPLVYYSSDGTLWALQRLFEYTRNSGDSSLLDEKMYMVMRFFAASMDFIQRGLLPSGGIIDKDYLWETWEDTPYTPRAGFPVEIELLWLTVLEEYLPAVRTHNGELADRMADALDIGSMSFQTLFPQEDHLADSVSYEWQPDPILTPNGYVAFGLDFLLPAALERGMVLAARDQLAGRSGIRSLAPRDWARVLPAAFLADENSHRGKNMASFGIFNYHRGIEWEWFNPFFVGGELACGDPDDAFRLYVEPLAHQALREGGIGGLSELYDLHGPLGADFQAWSMAGFIESLHLFAGVRVETAKRLMRVSPSVPRAWPYLHCRARVAEARFDLAYQRAEENRQHLAIRFVDQVPTAYTVEVEFRMPAGGSLIAATVNGHAVSTDIWTSHPGRTPDAAGSIRCTLPLDKETVIEVQITGDQRPQ